MRRDLILAIETVRALVASTAADRSRALVDRAALLVERGRVADAERDALAALELDARNIDAISTLERLYEGERRARELADELGRRAARLPPTDAAPLYFGRGRAAERAGDRRGARSVPAGDVAGPDAGRTDHGARRARGARGRLVGGRGAARERAGSRDRAKRKGPLLLELATVHGDRLGDPARAVSLLETAARHLPNDPRLMDLGARFHLAAGHWQVAADALDRLAARGATIADAAERYFAVGAAAEAAGEPDRALTLYSRSYGRDSGYRPTLERLSAICFERGQWDNAWKATEALLERHGPALSPADRATLLVRSALAICTSGSGRRRSRSCGRS